MNPSNSLITHVYAVVYEDAVYGVWTTPEIAVEFFFENELKTNRGIDLKYNDRLFTVQKAVAEMLKPGDDYPYLTKIKINPLDDKKMWDLPR
jgi:hypothetical protein